MITQLDQQFIFECAKLIRDILMDEARYVFKKDQSLQNLHNYIFRESVKIPLTDIPEMEKQFFRKYFYQNNGFGEPFGDVPFANSQNDQIDFFKFLKSQIALCTYNYNRMDFILPSFSDEKATEPVFSEYQKDFLFNGIISPLLHSIEQNQILKLEKIKQAGETGELAMEITETEQEASKSGKINPYSELGNKMLIKGMSGEFDIVIEYSQLEVIAGQEEMLRGQGLSQEEVVKNLYEFIHKIYPDLDIYLDKNAKIIPFLHAAGIKATSIEMDANSNSMQILNQVFGLPSKSQNLTQGQLMESGISCFEALAEMKIRQGRLLQYESILAGDGTLGLVSGEFQVKDSVGAINIMNGLSMGLDQDGQGSRVISFLADDQGVSTKLIIDTGEYRTDENVNFNFTLYETPDEDKPNSPKIKLGRSELERLKTPLLALYKQMLENREEFDKATDQYKTNDLTRETSLPDNLLSSTTDIQIPSQDLEEEKIGFILPQLDKRQDAKFTLPKVNIDMPQERAILHDGRKNQQQRQHKTAKKPVIQKQMAKQGVKQGRMSSDASKPFVYPKKEANKQQEEKTTSKKTKSLEKRRLAIAVTATGIPIAGALSFNLFHILMK